MQAGEGSLALDEDGLEVLRERMLRDAARPIPARLGVDDFKAALLIAARCSRKTSGRTVTTWPGR
ncbi:hypothetical protein ACVWZT_004427 [Pseudomonas sp. TE21394]